MPLEKCLRKICVLFGFLLFFTINLSLGPKKLAAEEVQPTPPVIRYDLYFAKGLNHLNQKKYTEAIAELKQALIVKPDDRDALYFLGVALNKAGNNDEAEIMLKRVLSIDPTFEKVHFELGVVEYELNKYSEALQELGLAEKTETNNALVYYYQGLTYHHMGDFERSSPKFLRSVALSPELGLTAHYYAGVGFYRRGIMLDAKDEFSEVIKIDSTSPVGQSAKEFLSKLYTPPKTGKRWDLNISTAYQKDSNVILLAGGLPPPAGIARKEDDRTVVYLSGSYRFVETEHWKLGTSYSYYQSFQDKLKSFDVQNHQGILFFHSQLSWGQVLLPYEYNFAQVNGENYEQSHAISPKLRISESKNNFTEIQYSLTVRDFVNSDQFSTNSDRNGVNHMAGIAKSIGIDNVIRFQMQYNYDEEISGGSPTEEDWAYTGHKIAGDLDFSIPLGMKLDLEGIYYMQVYENLNSFSSPSKSEKRTDQIQTYTATLSKTLGKWTTFSLQYLYNRNGSNLAIFDYDRNIMSANLAGNF